MKLQSRAFALVRASLASLNVVALLLAFSLLTSGAATSIAAVRATHQTIQSTTHCIATFKKMNHQLESDPIQPETRSKIVEYFLDDSLTPELRAKKAFNAVVSDRIRLLSKKNADMVSRFLTNRVTRFYQKEGTFVSGIFVEGLFQKKQIMLELPEKFRESILEYAILTHELEHYIQNLSTTDKLAGEARLFIDSLTNPADHTYERELGAMMAEFHFMKSIPLETRKAAKNEVMLYRFHLEKSSLEFLLSLLDVEKDEVSGYLEKQHLLGRYDRKAVEILAKDIRSSNSDIKTKALFMISAYSVIPAGMAINSGYRELNKFCRQIIAPEKPLEDDPPKKAAWIEICKQLKNWSISLH